MSGTGKNSENPKMNDLEPLNIVLEMNILTQDEQQMVQIVKRHYFENDLTSKQLATDIGIINRNKNNVELLCKGDSEYQQNLNNQLIAAKKILDSLKIRIKPEEAELKKKLNDLKSESEFLTTKLQNEEATLHKINESTESYRIELEKEREILKKLDGSMKSKISVHEHLNKSLISKRDMIKRLKNTMGDLEKKYMLDKQDLQLEKNRKQQQLDKLTMTQSQLEQQLKGTEGKLATEKEKYERQITELREKTRQTLQRRNDVAETFHKGEMDTRFLQAQLQRHNEKFKLTSKRCETAQKELAATNAEIEATKKKINEYASVPESHLNAIKQLTTDNQALQTEIEQLTKDEAEAREQAAKLAAELKELDGMDAVSRREKMERQQKNLRESLKRIDSAVTAAESSYTCFECLKPLKAPMTFVPCGHSVCKHHGKHTSDILECPECKLRCETVFSNPTIPDLLSKLQFLHSLVSTAIEN